MRARGRTCFTCAGMCFSASAPPARARAGDVRLFSAPGEGREAVEIVRRILDEAEAGVPFDEMAVFLRTPQHYLGLLEHACARGRRSRLFRSRNPAPGSCGARVHRAAVVRGRRPVGQAVRRISVARPGAAVAEAAASARRAESSRRVDELFAQPDDEAVEPESPEEIAGDQEPVSDSDDEAIVAGMLRAPWKWEELIVESAVVGGRTREDGGRDGGAASTASPPTTAPHRGAEARGAGVGAHRAVRARPDEPARTSASSRCRSWTSWPTGPNARRGASGLTASRGWRGRRSRGPIACCETLARSAADGRGRSGVARGSAGRAARSPGHARLGAAGAPLRPRVRRHAAPGARPSVPRRLRARPGRARRAAASARGSAAARRAAPRDRSTRSGRPGRTRAAPSGCC